MSTYIILANYTQQGIANIQEGPNRLDSAKETVKAMGCEIKGFFLTMGQYDLVALVEAPNDETLARLALTMGSGGAIRTETMRAFTEDEYRRITTAVPA